MIATQNQRQKLTLEFSRWKKGSRKTDVICNPRSMRWKPQAPSICVQEAQAVRPRPYRTGPFSHVSIRVWLFPCFSCSSVNACLRLVFSSINFRKTALLRKPAIRIGGKESPKEKTPEKFIYFPWHYTLALAGSARVLGKGKRPLPFSSFPFLSCNPKVSP